MALSPIEALQIICIEQGLIIDKESFSRAERMLNTNIVFGEGLKNQDSFYQKEGRFKNMKEVIPGYQEEMAKASVASLNQMLYFNQETLRKIWPMQLPTVHEIRDSISELVDEVDSLESIAPKSIKLQMLSSLIAHLVIYQMSIKNLGD